LGQARTISFSKPTGMSSKIWFPFPVGEGLGF
jgi:hypothetical protein